MLYSEKMLTIRGSVSSVHWLSHVQLFAIPWTAARQAFLSIANSWSLPKPMSIKSVMPSSHLIQDRIFLTQGSNTYLLCLLHWLADSLPLDHQGRLGPHIQGIQFF